MDANGRPADRVRAASGRWDEQVTATRCVALLRSGATPEDHDPELLVVLGGRSAEALLSRPEHPEWRYQDVGHAPASRPGVKARAGRVAKARAVP